MWYGSWNRTLHFGVDPGPLYHFSKIVITFFHISTCFPENYLWILMKKSVIFKELISLSVKFGAARFNLGELLGLGGRMCSTESHTSCVCVPGLCMQAFVWIKHFRSLKDHYWDYQDLTGTQTSTLTPSPPFHVTSLLLLLLLGAQSSQLTRICSTL